MTAKKEKIDTYSKNSFYRIIRLYSKKQREILRNLNAKICANTKEKLMIMIWRNNYLFWNIFSWRL